MKRIALILSAFTLSLSAFSQTNYGNNWIDFTGQYPYFKIKVPETGLHRIDYNTLSTALGSAGYSLAAVDPRDFMIYHNGEQQYIYIKGESDGTFSNNDFLEFYGEKNSGWPDDVLFQQAAFNPNPYYSHFNDTAAYFLTWNPSSLVFKKRLAEPGNNISNPPAKKQYYLQEDILEYHNQFQSGTKTLIQGVYLLDSRFDEGEGFTDHDFNKTSKSYSVMLDHIYSGSGIQSASVQFRMVSIYDQVHELTFDVNGVNYASETINGQHVRDVYFNVPLNNLNNGSSADVFTVSSSGSGSSDRNAVGFIKISYPRTFNFDNKQQWHFRITGTPGLSSYIEIDNFDAEASNPVLYDLTNHQRLLGIAQGGLYLFNIPMLGNDTLDLFLSSQQTPVTQVNSLIYRSFIDYSKLANQGNYIMISNKKLMSGSTDWVEAYRAYRASAAGGNYQAIVVDIDQLYDQFAYGIKTSPLAINHFAKYALDSFQVKPEHFFIVGNAFEYQSSRTNPAAYALNLVPTFGEPGSDNLLMTDGQDVTPFASIGRLAAQSPNDVRIYYNKTLALEANQNDPDQSISNKAWMKNVLHFGGGSDAGQQSLFRSFLSNYSKIIENPKFGGVVTSFFKTSPDPIQYLATKYLDSIINSGVSLITFFGHSSTGSFDINLDRPENYENYGKYPVMISNGCFAGQIHGGGGSASEEFVLTEDKGAIAFVSSSYYAEVSSLNTYTDKLYRYCSGPYYGKGIGEIIFRTKQFITDSLPHNLFLDFLTEQNTLHGDPAIRINPHEKPDYAVESRFIQFNPSIVTADLDSFVVKVIIHNLGRAIDTAFNVDVYRVFADGSQDYQRKRIKATYYLDTVYFTFFTDPVNGIGQNKFEVYLDPDNEIPEITTINNYSSNEMFINSDDAFPVYPYEFSILGNQQLTLKASTANPFEASKTYQFEIDTTEAFNSPLLLSKTLSQAGGVLSWNQVPLNWIDSTVYYWRVSPLPSGTNPFKWHKSSFVYISGSSPGWNQSHYFQFKSNKYNNLTLQNNRTFNFVSETKELKLVAGIHPYVNWSIIKFYVNGDPVDRWGCQGSGLNIAVFDATSGLPWYTPDYNFGEVECGYNNMKHTFHFKTSTQSERQNIINFLSSGIPDGNRILIYNFQDPHYQLWKADTAALGTDLFQTIAALGGPGLDGVDTLGYPVPFGFFCKKGDPANAQLVVGDTISTMIDTTFAFQGLWNNGFATTPLIGPAAQWTDFNWFDYPPDGNATDQVSVDLYGIDNSGNQTLLMPSIHAFDTTLNSVDPVLYPYLKLRWNVRDDSLRTAAQLDHWRIRYQPVPEAAVNPLLGFSINKDTFDQGDDLKLSTIIQNISPYDMDSMLVKFSIIDYANVRHDVALTRYPPLAANQQLQVGITTTTSGFPGNNLLILEANPDFDQPEQTHVNNFAIVPFYVMKDKYNPLMDVTFDAVHIMDGDIVSANPEIIIRLKDENKYLAMDDTSLIQVSFKYPDGFKKPLNWVADQAEFIPADTTKLGTDNSAMIIAHPTFISDGNYQLIVSGRDKTGNETGKTDYQVGFEVINKAMISNVLNYPNPFSTSTHFIFTLTGTTIPDFMKIQIMTVSGKIVREISMAELGNVHIGRNISEFAWDGTDQFGDPLANGVYLYRVVASSNGSNLESYASAVDKYFKKGFGKMYLMR